MLVNALLMTGCGALMTLLGIPMMLRKVGRNPLYGFRTPKTLSSDEIWYPANEYSGRLFVAYGSGFAAFALVACGVCAAVLPPAAAGTVYPIVCTVALLLGLGAVVVLSFQYLDRL